MKRKFWIFVTVPVLIILADIFAMPAKSVRALLNDPDIVVVITRFYREIVLPSQAGQYYEALVGKHWDEISRLYLNHPERREELIEVIKEFVPGMEALLDGKGDTVQITAGQIQHLKAEVDWLASAGSLSLREDIEQELERYPLEQFIGMTMSEALEYVNTNFPTD